VGTPTLTRSIWLVIVYFSVVFPEPDSTVPRTHQYPDITQFLDLAHQLLPCFLLRVQAEITRLSPGQATAVLVVPRYFRHEPGVETITRRLL
jgi:hypothetical protein